LDYIENVASECLPQNPDSDWMDIDDIADADVDDDVMEGVKVSIEYSPVPYGGKKSRGNDDGFPPGCTFKLYSITVLGMTDRPMLDVSSPSKRRKLNYS
jgi:hypothetical protein